MSFLQLLCFTIWHRLCQFLEPVDDATPKKQTTFLVDTTYLIPFYFSICCLITLFRIHRHGSVYSNSLFNFNRTIHLLESRKKHMERSWIEQWVPGPGGTVLRALRPPPPRLLAVRRPCRRSKIWNTPAMHPILCWNSVASSGSVRSILVGIPTDRTPTGNGVGSSDSEHHHLHVGLGRQNHGHAGIARARRELLR